MKLDTTNSVIMTILGPSGSRCIIYEQPHSWDTVYSGINPYKAAGEAIKAFMEGERAWLESQELRQSWISQTWRIPGTR